MSLYLVWIGDGSDPAHFAGLNADLTLCGELNAGSSWTWDYPDLSTPVCPTCRAKATGL